jgi:hypothetical protein|tara:strand:- start:598 stop:1443 length:846 start_codon:yes stop_codon:yes gene_type:complete
MTDQIKQYARFLNSFGTHHSFQTFGDKGLDKRLIKQLHGTIDEHVDKLQELNKKGAGVFFTVNRTDLHGRTTKNIKSVRAVFIDLDGTPLPTRFELQPNLIVNTSPDKYHCYWLVDDMPLQSFVLYQEALALKFNSDPVVKDLPRVMRVAGFYHNKHKPYPIKIVEEYNTNKPYHTDEIRDKLKLERPKSKMIIGRMLPRTTTYKRNGIINGASKGNRHETLVRMLISMRLRGETLEYARNEAIAFANACDPPEDIREVLFQLNDIWSRYEAKRIPTKSNE